MTIYTIGHSNHAFEHFARLLHQHGVITLVDVRSQPYSRYVPHFSKEALRGALAEVTIDYLHLGDALGGKLGSGYADKRGNPAYERRAREPSFGAGVEQLLGIAVRATTAIMCAEEDPRRCHRRLLVTPALVHRGAEVTHIRGNGTLETEASLARQSQLSLF